MLDGVLALYAYPPDVVTVEGCTFRDNDSDPRRAEALFIHAVKTVNIRGSAFVGNHATASGGAIWADGAATYTFENDLFSGNVADSDLGGALRLEVAEQAKVGLFSSTFADNEAQGGNGALWLPGMRDVHVRNSIFANNTATGAAQQINFLVTSEGGKYRVARSPGELDDPDGEGRRLATLTLDLGAWVRALREGSPAIGAAIAPASLIDQRGA